MHAREGDCEKWVQWLHNAVSDHPRGHLTLEWRVRMWHFMRTTFADHNYRRNCLLLFVAQWAIQVWSRTSIVKECDPGHRDVYVEGVPACVDLLRRYLGDDEECLSSIISRCTRMAELWDYVSSFFADDLSGGVPLVVIEMRQRVAGWDDRSYQSEGWYDSSDNSALPLEDDLYSDHFWADSHYWAATLAARLPSKGKYEDDSARAAFWHRWVDNDLRFVMGPLAPIQSRVRACSASSK
jgi:hypothetical protein